MPSPPISRVPAKSTLGFPYGFAHERPGVMTRALGAARIVPLCAPSLLRKGIPVKDQIAKMTLIDSQLSRVTWPGWFALNGLEMPRGPRPSFDRAALAISAAADGMGVALETTRLAERELTARRSDRTGRGCLRAARKGDALSFLSRQ